MSEKSSEKSEMSSVEFVSDALRRRVAPPSVGAVKARIRHAARELGWTYSRTKDAWYADPRIAKAYAQPDMFVERAPEPVQQPLFGEAAA